MKTKKLCAVLSAMLMACSTMPAMGFNAAAREGYFPGKDDPKIRSITESIHNRNITPEITPDMLSFDTDVRINFNDFKIVEKAINDLYVSNGINYYQTEENGTLKYNSIPCNNDTKKYDINGDNNLSPDDYCTFLNALSQQFVFSVSQSDGVNSQLTATITGINVHRDIDNLVIPAEIYDINTDRIYPVTEIGANAFANLTNLKNVEMSNYVQPDWVDEYGRRIATRGKITASNPLIIDSGAFKGCTNLETVVLPEYVSVCEDSFEGTPFFKNNKNDTDYDVKILTGSSNAEGKSSVVAYGIRNVDVVGNMRIPACVTSISKYLASEYRYILSNITFETDKNGHYNIGFIGEGAFCNCEKLKTVNSVPFNQLDEELQNTLYKYVSSFDCTAFMADETSRQLDKIFDKITNTPGFDQMNDAEKTLVAAKYYVYSVYYNNWYTSSSEFSLYPNAPYSTVDLARACCNSEFAALNVRFTCCEGITKGFALVLDRIGVKNLTKGEPNHALNLVYIPDVSGSAGKWFNVDLSSCCNQRTTEIMSDENRNDDLSLLRGYDEKADLDNCDSKVVNSMTIDNEYLSTLTVPADATFNILKSSFTNGSTLSNNNFFHLFSSSKGKHVTGDEAFAFIFNNDNSKILLYKAGNNTSYKHVKSQAEKQEDLIPYINEGLIDFIDVADSKNRVLKYDNYNLDYMLDKDNGWIYVASDIYNLDSEYRFHSKNGEIIKNDYVKFNNVSVSWNPAINCIYFIVGDEGTITFKDNREVYHTVRAEKKGNKVYCYDLNSNEALNARFTYGDYFWSFENGELVCTNCID